MDVEARGASALADAPDLLALFDPRARLDVQRIQVRIPGFNSCAVRDSHKPSVTILVVVRVDHPSVGRRDHGRALWNGNVNAAMRMGASVRRGDGVSEAVRNVGLFTHDRPNAGYAMRRGDGDLILPPCRASAQERCGENESETNRDLGSSDLSHPSDRSDPSDRNVSRRQG
jgi:hypothetical protein